MLVVLLLAIKHYFNGSINKNWPFLNNKIALITGGNCGIGFETAQELARVGLTLIIACRDKKKGIEAQKKIISETSNKRVFFYELDLASFESIHSFAKIFKKNFSKLHILVNNAGALGFAKKTLSKDGIEMTMAVNHFGHFLLTNLLLDELKVYTLFFLLLIYIILKSLLSFIKLD